MNTIDEVLIDFLIRNNDCPHYFHMDVKCLSIRSMASHTAPIGGFIHMTDAADIGLVGIVATTFFGRIDLLLRSGDLEESIIMLNGIEYKKRNDGDMTMERAIRLMLVIITDNTPYHQGNLENEYDLMHERYNYPDVIKIDYPSTWGSNGENIDIKSCLDIISRRKDLSHGSFRFKTDTPNGYKVVITGFNNELSGNLFITIIDYETVDLEGTRMRRMISDKAKDDICHEFIMFFLEYIKPMFNRQPEEVDEIKRKVTERHALEDVSITRKIEE